METTPRKLKVAFYASIAFAAGFALLFARNVFIDEYAWSLYCLGMIFACLSWAANPGIFFLNVATPRLWQPTQGTQRYFGNLMWISHAGALIVWMVGDK